MRALTAGQITAIQHLSLPKAERPSVDKIAAEVGVSRSTIYAWQKDLEFIAELKAQIVRNNVGDLPELVGALTRMAIDEKSAAMAKLALQVHGMLTDKVEVQTQTSPQTTDIAALRSRIEAVKGRQHEQA
ncbi:phBC6A51 family helix-turn-helix protein [Paenibacillus xylanilyticus]|uniref:Helix-turn-helix domain-containing protein n=1 Tax=Paenibacillus xylanilyticus TaxID=248903 RepID=A0A7Y6ERT3_9BACL|nr:phBC6A51 family helix-turn-helix protein [Paenibacillus xylanilyticus]NUU74242.1 helix-turn-helix domain-containing protein [Paenibacillus xylanilyticus]